MPKATMTKSGRGSTTLSITDITQRALEAMDFTVTRNKPYAGGFTTRHYGRPKDSIHVLQVEINRALYMDEKRVERGHGLPRITQRIGRLMRVLVDIDREILKAAA